MLAGMAPVAMSTDDREESGDYVGVPPAHVIAHHRATPDPAPDAGGQSFDILDTDESISVEVNDAVNEHTRNVLAFYDGNGDLIYGTGFCDAIDNEPVPRDHDGFGGDSQTAATAVVFVAHDTYFAFWGWGEIGDCTVAPPTTGTITATFS